MDLLPKINSQPLLRQHGIPDYLRRVCVITITSELAGLPAFHQAHPWLIIERIALADGKPSGSLDYRVNDRECSVPVGDLLSIIGQCHLEKIILNPENDAFAQIPEAICRLLEPVGLRNFFVYGKQPIRTLSPRRDVDFLPKNIQSLNANYALLADEASRECFAARIKAVITGDTSYLPIAGFPEYFHPQVKPEAGDVMLDGGISDNVDVQIKFAEAVGPNGQIYGFEPIPDMFAVARQKLSAYANYEINNAGLGANKGKTRFELLGDSSRMSDKLDNTVECEIISIDDFVRERNLDRVDCIKLDIEGAELSALLGARQTIKRFQPKLIICLYHKNEDLYELPAMIKKLLPEYSLFAAHSSYHFIDTILYAKVLSASGELA